METIKSKDNKTIKHISKLIADSKYRKLNKEFVVEGKRLCKDALLSNCTVVSALVNEEFYNNSNNKDFIDLLSKESCKKYIVDNRIFSALSDTKTPQGVLFVLKTLDKNNDFDKIIKHGKVLALENIQDPSNLGTILRTAEAFCVNLVVLSKNCCDIYSPKVVRGSMGAVFRQKIYIADDFIKFIKEYNKIGRSYAAVLDDESIKLGKCDFWGPCMAIVGNEGNGLTKDAILTCTNKLYIPMSGKAESLNVSVASSLIMWEMMK